MKRKLSSGSLVTSLSKESGMAANRGLTVYQVRYHHTIPRSWYVCFSAVNWYFIKSDYLQTFKRRKPFKSSIFKAPGDHLGKIAVEIRSNKFLFFIHNICQYIVTYWWQSRPPLTETLVPASPKRLHTRFLLSCSLIGSCKNMNTQNVSCTSFMCAQFALQWIEL